MATQNGKPLPESRYMEGIEGLDATRLPSSVANGFTLLARATAEFEERYRKAVTACLTHKLPLTICTIDNGNFPDRDYQRQVATALALFNDAIIRVGAERALSVLDLRQICNWPDDYANAIEPSSIGRAKMAKAIARIVTDPRAVQRRGALVTGTG